MATARVRLRVAQPKVTRFGVTQSKLTQAVPFVERRAGAANSRAAFRLLSAERSDEIFPILLEEILTLGFARAMVSNLDFDTGEMKPAAAIQCSKSFQQRFSTALWQAENPIIAVLNTMQPAVIPRVTPSGGPLYCHPIIYRNRNLCWEAERGGRTGCLAVQNFTQPGTLNLQEQVCRTWNMRAYAGVVVVDLPGRN